MPLSQHPGLGLEVFSKNKVISATETSLEQLISRFKLVRKYTQTLCEPLQLEDFVVQPSIDVSPPKWHLAHTSWFFANFILANFANNFIWPSVHYPTLFNSYYKSEGEHWPQAKRGMLSRPTLREILLFRNQVDQQILDLTESYSQVVPIDFLRILRLGIEHEMQHQELLLMDILYIYWTNLSHPIYHELAVDIADPSYDKPIKYIPHDEGLHWFGYSDVGGLEFSASASTNDSSEGFAFDNEQPSHRYYLHSFAIADRLVSNREYLEFIAAGGYEDVSLWLSEGWDYIQANQITKPLYWLVEEEHYHEFDLRGVKQLNPSAPVRHVSYYEADAFARWAGKRLPNEYEWEFFGRHVVSQGIFLEQLLGSSDWPATDRDYHDVHGTLWQWTSSAYTSYPGYTRPQGALGEYNGKFMTGQKVLRGGCYATPRSHYRPTYRNFYHPDKRWQFTGIRLAEDRT